VLAAWLAEESPQRLLTIISTTPADAERWLSDLQHLTDVPIALYPQREALEEERTTRSRVSGWKRLPPCSRAASESWSPPPGRPWSAPASQPPRPEDASLPDRRARWRQGRQR
jgi:hypothetical protein